MQKTGQELKIEKEKRKKKNYDKLPSPLLEIRYLYRNQITLLDAFPALPR